MVEQATAAIIDATENDMAKLVTNILNTTLIK